MQAEPAHTPYSGASTPFTIGLKPLDLATWLEIDAHYGAYLEEKDRLIAEKPHDVFAAEDGTAEAQQEVLGLVRQDLAVRTPRLADLPTRALVEARLACAGDNEPDLQRAARLIQEDLVLMRRDERGWRLAAASLCFPSSWNLTDKFSRPLTEIHVPVPGFGPGTRNAELIDRIFDRLLVTAPVERLNWSIQPDAGRHKPMTVDARGERGRVRPSRFADAAAAAAAFIRVERQTLRKLPVSGDILFTIRIHVDPFAVLERHAHRKALATSFAAQLGGLDTAQLDYKGLTSDRDLLVSALQAIAEG